MRSSQLAAFILAALFSGFSSVTWAAVSAQEAERLNTELTPLGAERAGNGSDIPAWQGGLTEVPAGYNKSGQHHVDPFADDAVISRITAANYQQYAEFLTAGQQALFERYPSTFSMPIYQTRRTASAPQWVYDNTYQNALTGTIDRSGSAISNVYGGIPFPLAESGIEAIWNHIARWRGVYIKYRAAEAAVQNNGRYSLSSNAVEVEFNYYRPDKTQADLENILFYLMAEVRTPTRLAGNSLLVHEPLNQAQQARQAWAYNAGQRRVRRAPDLGFDTPIPGTDGLVVADEGDLFNGSPERYQWRLIGKQEKYIAYNNFRLADPQLSYKEVLQTGHINPEFTRYEKHRVWVVEAQLKDNERHIYGKRRFYLDEDTWGIVAADLYDGKGELWRVTLSYPRTFYEVPATWSGGLNVFHDLQSGRYHVQGLVNDETTGPDYSHRPPGARKFTPAELRRRGKR